MQAITKNVKRWGNAYLKKLWGGIVGRANERIELHISSELAAEAKVNDFRIAVVIQKHI